MTNNDEFDVDLELEDGNADTFAEDPGFEEEQPAKAKKSGGGFFVKFLLFLVLVAGGLFASVKYLGVQLPFEVPYLNQLAGVQAPATPAAQQPSEQQTAAVDLSAGAAGQPAAMEAIDGWVDDPTAAAADTAADTGNVMVGDAGMLDDGMSGDPAGAVDTTDAAMDPAVTATTPVDDFGLPPTTEGATDLSATTDTGAADVWGSMPEAQQDTQDTASVSEDPFGATALETPSVEETPVVTSPVPTDTAVAATTTAAVTAPVNDVALADLEKKVTALEKSLADLQKNTATKSDIDALKTALANIEKSVADTPTAVKPAPAKAEAKATADEEVKSSPAKKTSVTAAKKAPVVRKSWVLRSAKPGMAWISEKGTGEIKTISVGDTVAGIGKVTAIAKDSSGLWVVNGTQGKINQ